MNAAMRTLVRARAGHRCEYCQTHQEDSPLATLHIEQYLLNIKNQSSSIINRQFFRVTRAIDERRLLIADFRFERIDHRHSPAMISPTQVTLGSTPSAAPDSGLKSSCGVTSPRLSSSSFQRFSFDSVHAVCGLAGSLGVRYRSLGIQNFSFHPVPSPCSPHPHSLPFDVQRWAFDLSQRSLGEDGCSMFAAMLRTTHDLDFVA
jgi:hypothetical protein